MIGATTSQSSVQRMDRPPPRTTGASASGGVDTSSTNASDKLSQLFSSIDSDGSGGLSSSELQSFVDTMSKDTRGALLSVQEGATSSDGTSTTSSASSSSAQAFDAIDTDGDGAISESELSGFMQANMPPPPPPPEGGAAEASDSSSTTSASSTSSSMASDLMSSIDTDGDGSVSQSELSSFLEANAPPPPPPPEASGSSSTSSANSSSSSEETSGTASSSGSSSTFSAIDTNQDGQISKAELDAYLSQSGTASSSSSSGSTTAASSSTGSGADALAGVLAQLLQQSYQRMQVSAAEMQASLTKSLDSVA